jgi:aryl-alcohol dehydrogenase-like predicted oxidoreductase
MEYGHIAGIDKPISRLVQGTGMVGPGREDHWFSLFDAVFAEGCNAFDTAHVYGDGDCERTLGRWIRERGIRDRLVLIDKGAHLNADRARVTPFDIEADLHDSLARLGVDFIDVYLLHRDDPRVPVGPLIEVLNKHQAAGKIGIFGGSNWSTERLEEANEYAATHNLTPFAVSSPNFSLASPNLRLVAEHDAFWAGCVSVAGDEGRAARQWYGAHNMPLLAWSSLACGFFSGRFRRDNLETFSEYFDRICVKSYCHEDNFDRLARAETLGRERGLTPPQVALAFVMNHPLNTYALVGCRTAEEFRANAAALAIKLTPEELAWLEQGTPESVA